MTIIGLDLSLTATGYINLCNGKILEQKLIKSKPVGDKPTDELKRILGIVKEISVKGSDLVVVEGIAFGIRKTTSLAQLSALNYFVRNKCYENKIPFVIAAPTSLKKFVTGKGNIHKELMLMETYKKYGISFSENNLCDSYGLSKIGEALLGKEKLPVYQAEVVKLLKKQLN